MGSHKAFNLISSSYILAAILVYQLKRKSKFDFFRRKGKDSYSTGNLQVKRHFIYCR